MKDLEPVEDSSEEEKDKEEVKDKEENKEDEKEEDIFEPLSFRGTLLNTFKINSKTSY